MLKTIAYETWKRATENLRSLYQLRMSNILAHVPKVLTHAQNDLYEIKTIFLSRDLYTSLKLRNELSQSSFDLHQASTLHALSDDFDTTADHIMIRDKRNNSIIGGFRLISSNTHPTLSCENAFDLIPLKQHCSRILEISRLFLLPEHKHADIIHLAARFLSEYSLNAQTEMIVSRQSINSGASRNAALAYRYLSILGAKNSEIVCKPQLSHQAPNFIHWNNHFKEHLSAHETYEGAALLSAVFQESLRLGATISGYPSLDRSTNRIDFLTLLHKEDLNRSLWTKSQLSSGSSSEYSYF